MDSFDSYLLRKIYKKTARHHDKLAKIEPLIDWTAFKPIIQPIYSNQGPSGGRPNTDPVLMVKLLVLQAWYGLSDPELERQASLRIDFMHFLGYPEKAPDYSTVWRFRERLAETGRDRLVWEELQRQLDEKGLKVRKVWCRTHHSSPRTPATPRPRSLVEMGQRHGGAGTVRGLRKAANHILVISCT